VSARATRKSERRNCDRGDAIKPSLPFHDFTVPSRLYLGS
jgi:hypothetical protein